MNINHIAFYVIALFTAFLQSIFGTLAGFLGHSPHFYIFGKIAGALSLVTWIWILVLIRYNRRPQSANPLCRSYAHLISFAVFGVVWLGIGIMLATQTPWECSGDTVWCAAARFSTALAFFTSASSVIAVYLIYRSSDTRRAANVDQAPIKPPSI